MPALAPGQLRELFVERFGRPPTHLARAPGRVNLIGEHTDYNAGYVLPMALEQCTWVAAAPRGDQTLRVVALDLDAEQLWPIAEWHRDRYPAWTSYVAGAAILLRRRGLALAGADLLIHSDVPVGSGLSSSAALEVAGVLVLAALAGGRLEGVALADFGRAVEHEFAGVPCGIMDQYISVLGRAGHALLLDCRSRTWDHIPMTLGAHAVLIVNSGVRHQLATGEYARRQEQCRMAVEYFRCLRPDVKALRDVNPEEVAEHASRMDSVAARRARHVASENRRTQAAAAALRRGDLAELGRLMDASHASLRDDYEVSCRELDLLVELVRGVPGVLGARMTGGGFGGCIVALAPAAAVPQIEQRIRREYDAAGFGPARTLESRPGAGAALEA